MKKQRSKTEHLSASPAVSQASSSPTAAPPGPRPAPRRNWSDPLGFPIPPGGEWTNPLGNWSNPLGNWSVPIGLRRGMGYHPDLPDRRDCGWTNLSGFIQQTKAAENARVKGLVLTAPAALPTSFNLGDQSEHPLPPVEDQGQTNSCTAQAAAVLVEYLYRWATGTYDHFSRLFIYYNARKLLGWTGDNGAYIRTTFKAMRLFGVPPEPEWPFDPALLENQPQPYHYSYASNFKTMSYARLDGYGDPPAKTLERLKQTIYAGFPVEFGFPVYSSIQNMQNFVIPVPLNTDKLVGGHAILAVGYDDTVEYVDDQGAKQKGAICIQNSWGISWGDHGYGFLPYWYITQGYALDFWTAYDKRWLNLNEFD